MCDLGDEDLLNGEDESDCGCDLSDEKVEALLQDEFDEDYIEPKIGRDVDKKESLLELDESEEDVLNLDIEEDFQEVEEKIGYEEEEADEKRKDGKFANERVPITTNTTTVTKPPPRTQFTNKIISTNIPKPTLENANKAKIVQNIKKVPLKIDKRRRGNGRVNFQTRGNFTRNIIQKERRQERRNTVFINPKYEGIVHINENNARLAWDNSNYQQNNFIQPWASGNVPGNCDVNFQDPSLLINNLVSEIATISHTSPNLFQIPTVQQPQPQNFFQQPVYQQQMAFEPPNLQNSQQPYNNQNQVSTRPTFPSQTASHQSYQATGLHQQFSNQPIINDRLQNVSKTYNSYTNYDYYNRPNNQQNYSANPKKNFTSTNYENRNLNYNNTVKQNQFEIHKNNFSKDNYQNRNTSYVADGYQKRNPAYTNNFMKQRDFKNQHLNYNTNSFENRNLNKMVDGTEGGRNNALNVPIYGSRNLEDVKQGNFNKRNINNRTFNNPSQNYYNNYYNKESNQSNVNMNSEMNKTNTFNQSDNRNFPQRNLMGPKYNTRRPVLNESTDTKETLPEKKIKTEANVVKAVEKNNEESKKAIGQSKQETTTTKKIMIDEEDEEMKLYRLKIEEQKREREKVLKMKEERRKQMLQQQKAEEEKSAANVQPTQPQAPAAAVPRQKPNFYHQAGNNIPVLSTRSQFFKEDNRQSSVEDEMSNLTFKVSNNLQKTASASVPKTEQSSHGFMSNRVVVVKNSTNQKGGALPNSIVKTVNNETSSETDDVGQGLSSFFNNRKVLKKDNSLINTRLVVVNNLSASTNQSKLVAMTRGIGEIQKLRMDKQERQATILFKSVASAHAFFKKYQRHILDLSVIEVKLEPMI